LAFYEQTQRLHPFAEEQAPPANPAALHPDAQAFAFKVQIGDSPATP